MATESHAKVMRYAGAENAKRTSATAPPSPRPRRTARKIAAARATHSANSPRRRVATWPASAATNRCAALARTYCTGRPAAPSIHA